MGAVRMYIDKFGAEVLIDETHPLAIAQMATAVAPSAARLEQPAPELKPEVEPDPDGDSDASPPDADPEASAPATRLPKRRR